MTIPYVSDARTTVALELFQPRPGTTYSLDDTAQLAGLHRRALLVYWRAGLVDAVLQPPYGVIAFTEEAIYALRRIERLRLEHGVDLALLKTIVALLDEVDYLRAELRASRTH